MVLRVALVLGGIVLSVPALAQGSCVAQSTPDSASHLDVPALFPHCLGDKQCGAVDKTGAWKIPPVHIDLIVEQDFIVVPENEEWSKFAFLDATGQKLGGGDYSINIEEEVPVAEGLLPVIAGGKMGYADRTGALVIPATFDEAFAFQEGLASVVAGGRNLFIDKTGNTIVTVPEGIDDVGFFSKHGAVVGRQGTYGLLGRDGAFVFEPRFPTLYADGPILVGLEGDRLGIVGPTGEWVSPTDFQSIGSFSNGVAPAEKEGKWGFIDTCGNWKIEPQYDLAAGFDGGPGRVKIGDKWGLIDQAGKEIVPPTFFHVSDGIWIDGLISYSPDEEKYGIIDTTGKIVIEARYDSIEPIGGGVLLAYSGEDEKMLNLDGSEIMIQPKP